MKDKDKVQAMKNQIEDLRPYLSLEGDPRECIRKSLCLIVDYIEFMITPCEDDE